MRIRNFVHKSLKRLYTEDTAKGVPPDTVDKLRKMLAFLDDMEDPEELRALPAWKVHTHWRSEGNVELKCYTQPPPDVSCRPRRARNLRREFGRLPLRQKEKAPWL